MQEIRDRFANMEFLIIGDMNSRTGIKQINLPHLQEDLNLVNSNKDSGHSDRSSKDTIVNEEGGKLVEFCKRKFLELLNGKYGEGNLTFINYLGRCVIDYSLVLRETLEILVNFRVGVEILSSHMPITLELASGIEVTRNNTMIQTGRTAKIVRFRWKDDKTAAFLTRLSDQCSEQCLHGVTRMMRGDEAVKTLDFQIKRGTGETVLRMARWTAEGRMLGRETKGRTK
jgi:hypothetical protein